SGSFSFDDVTWQLVVRNASASVVRTASGQGQAFTFEWNGQSDSAQLQPDGAYTFELVATIGTAVANDAKSATLDNTPPSVSITSPGGSQVLSNVYAQGLADVTISGLATDANFSSWTLEYGLGAAPTSWTTLRSAVPTPVNGTLAVWPTLDKTNGLYSLRLRAVDKAGNQAATTNASTVGNFKVTQNVLQLNSAAGGTVTYTSTVPFPLTETLVIKDRAGAVVKTLIDGSRQAGSYVDPWNGRRETAVPAPDGLYLYIATVTDGTHTMTWDLSGQYLNDYFDYTYPVVQSYDPFNNQPMRISYNFSQPGRMRVVLTTLNISHVTPTCDPPNICVRNDYEPAGPRTVEWALVDSTGVFIPGIVRGVLIKERLDFPKNGVVVFGTSASVTGVRVSPPVFGPAVGEQEVSFDLSTYQGGRADVELTFINHESRSQLRKVMLADQLPGHITWRWDGRADNGMLVAPGPYTVTVKAVDELGNEASGQILTRIQY